LYGSTYQGGPNQGLQPFIAPQTNRGKVGTSVNILGLGFTGTSSIPFNGTSATFAVVSDTFMTATIPTGATTGFLTGTTAAGTVRSNQKFKATL
jgi:hypothetical protein